ncbi:MAG: HlyC/CorC family transporter [Pseudomonadota bacterium]
MGAEETPMVFLLLTIVGMVALSAYFSSSETAMMAVNRYRLRHLEQEGDPAAKRTNDLLSRPDRLLGVILIGNNLVNFSAATVATVIGLRLFGDIGVAAAPIVLTLLFLIFAEVAPKTIAAQFPERIAFPSSYVLGPLLKLLYPVVWFVNTISNLVVSPFARHADDGSDAGGDQLTQDEIRTLVNENEVLPERRQNMLLNVLDLEKVTVDDIMVPRAEIVGIDLDDPIEDILTLLASSEHTRLPVYRENINDIVGVLHLRRAVRLLKLDNVTIQDVEKQVREPYFVPEATPLNTQLLNFQKEKRRIALVVDEYGDIEGIVTLEDILEEIVGEFTTDLAGQIEEITPLDDGSFEIDAMAQLRDINKALGWTLPTDGPKTLNGFVLEHLGVIPDANAGLEVDGYRLEILGIERNRVLNVRAEAPREPPGEGHSNAS